MTHQNSKHRRLLLSAQSTMAINRYPFWTPPTLHEQSTAISQRHPNQSLHQ
jgi:hypothetical protein